MAAETRPTPDPRPVHAHCPVEVRYAETDQMGVVHHSVYLVWFEVARTALCRESGHPYAEIERMGYHLVVSGTEGRYLRPALYGDTVTVDCHLAKMTSRSLRFLYRVLRGDEVLVTGATEHIWVDAASRRACRMPEILRRPFERLAGRGPQDDTAE